jgi:hypothetical protein
MTEKKTWPISIRYGLREPPSLDLPLAAYWDTYGFALLDAAGNEHHFGFREHFRSEVVFTWIASYSDEGREDWPGDVHDNLSGCDYELVDPTMGPRLSELTKFALEDVCEYSEHKGFAFDEERTRAVRTFLALQRAGETFDPDEVYVLGATNGLRPKDAKMFKEYTQRAIDGRGSGTVTRRRITLDQDMGDKMIAYWREKLASGATSDPRD